MNYPLRRPTSGYPLRLTPGSSHTTILAWLGQGQGRRLLDVGGGGVMTNWLRSQGWKVLTIDREGEPDFTVDLDTEVPAIFGRFDRVVCADVLEHLRDPAGVLRWLRHMLTPDGRLLVSVPNVGHLYARLTLLRGDWPRHPMGIFDETHRHFWTRSQARGLMTSAGYDITRQGATCAPVGPFRRLHALVASLWPTLFGYQTVLEARESNDARHWRVAKAIMP